MNTKHIPPTAIGLALTALCACGDVPDPGDDPIGQCIAGVSEKCDDEPGGSEDGSGAAMDDAMDGGMDGGGDDAMDDDGDDAADAGSDDAADTGSDDGTEPEPEPEVEVTDEVGDCRDAFGAPFDTCSWDLTRWSARAELEGEEPRFHFSAEVLGAPLATDEYRAFELVFRDPTQDGGASPFPDYDGAIGFLRAYEIGGQGLVLQVQDLVLDVNYDLDESEYEATIVQSDDSFQYAVAVSAQTIADRMSALHLDMGPDKGPIDINGLATRGAEWDDAEALHWTYPITFSP